MRVFVMLAALALLAGLARGDSEGDYGDVHVDTELSAIHNTLTVTLSTTDDQGNPVTRGPITVTADPQGDGKDVLTSPDIPLDGETYRWRNGKFQKKQADGTWKTIPKKKGGKKGSSTMMRLAAGDIAPHDGILFPDGGLGDVPLLMGEVAPYSGYFSSPGDEVTSLPFPGGGG